MKKLYFNKNKKQELLQGRTIRYLASEIDCSEIHLTNILNGKTSCGKYLAKDILRLMPNATKEDYFDIK